jgi:putative Mg2+ transporter-C (MgtC) family protein
MSLMLQAEVVVTLLLAVLLGGLIGLNREQADRPAGFRTHMLVAVGSTLFTLLSVHAFDPGDPGRVASQILPGMGFLGAGAILKESGDIKGLTTAASLWSTAAIGMAVGVGAWLLAIACTVVVWSVLALVYKMTPKLRNNRNQDQD